MKGKVFFSSGKVAEAGSTGILNINGKKMKITLNKENIMKLVEKGIVDGCCFSLDKNDYNKDDINKIKEAGIDKMFDVFNEMESKSKEELHKELMDEEEARMKSIEREVEINDFKKMDYDEKRKYIMSKVCNCIDEDKNHLFYFQILFFEFF